MILLLTVLAAVGGTFKIRISVHIDMHTISIHAGDYVSSIHAGDYVSSIHADMHVSNFDAVDYAVFEVVKRTIAHALACVQEVNLGAIRSADAGDLWTTLHSFVRRGQTGRRPDAWPSTAR